MKQQFLTDKADTIRLTAYSNNRPLVPSAATVTLYKAESTSVLQAEAAATVGATGEMTYSLTTTHTADTGLNFKAVWKYTVDAVDYYESQLFDVVKSRLSIPITDDDIFDELEALRKVYKQATGTATAGAAGSLTDTTRREAEADNYWKGGIIEIISGTGDGQIRDITGSVQSTGVISVTPDWVTNPDTTSVYRIVKSFTKKIQSGFEAIEQMLYDKGRRDALILESSQIKVPLIYLTIHMICLDIFSEVDDKWFTLAKNYWERFNTTMGTLRLDYDEDESGAIEEAEAQKHINALTINRA